MSARFSRVTITLTLLRRGVTKLSGEQLPVYFVCLFVVFIPAIRALV